MWSQLANNSGVKITFQTGIITGPCEGTLILYSFGGVYVLIWYLKSDFLGRSTIVPNYREEIKVKPDRIIWAGKDKIFPKRTRNNWQYRVSG